MRCVYSTPYTLSHEPVNHKPSAITQLIVSTLSPAGKLETEDAPVALPDDAELATVVLCDATRNRQAEPGAFADGLGREERIEDPLQ